MLVSVWDLIRLLHYQNTILQVWKGCKRLYHGNASDIESWRIKDELQAVGVSSIYIDGDELCIKIW